MKKQFPNNFLWGGTLATNQVEGDYQYRWERVINLRYATPQSHWSQHRTQFK